MDKTVDVRVADSDYELVYRSLFMAGRAFAFPCDARGWVDTDTLSATARASYLRVSASVGREFAVPALVRAGAAFRHQQAAAAME